MKLTSLIKDCALVSSVNLKDKTFYDTDILSIASNSKDVKPGTLFIAVKGFVADGHDYIEQAFAKGAVAVIAQNHPKNSNDNSNNHSNNHPNNRDRIILVKNSRIAMADIADKFYESPSKGMTLVGITGTNGKTTISWILESIFKACGFSTGVIGTVNIRYNGKEYDTPVTTPDSIDLQKTLYKMKMAGISHVIMEVSSHGLDLKRVDFCDFDIGVFTNLSQDHLDYHENMDEYFNCKKRLFTQLLKQGNTDDVLAVINIDDTKGKSLFNSLEYKTIGISTQKRTNVFAQDINDDIHGISGTICMEKDSFKFESSLIGRFNLENILCAAGAAHALHIKLEYIKKGIKSCNIIPGRLEKINNSGNQLGNQFLSDRFLFVDYAHTPDALDSILRTLRQIAPERIITVFGCGGDRDKSKRALMGEIACKHSNIAIVSSDNPRTENPDSIIDDILKGLKTVDELSKHEFKSSPYKQGYIIETDRKKAIKKAVEISKPGDIIVVAGKGHETYQITNTGTIHFDDREELENACIEVAQKPSPAALKEVNPIAWTIDDFVKALNCDPVFPIKKDYKFTTIGTDSRTIEKNQLFLALKGENFDGHKFIKELINKGIKGFIVQKGLVDTLEKKFKEKFKENNLVSFEVENTLTALGKLARYQRLRSNAKVLAITGSYGKTTTRKIIQEIFKTQFHTLSSKGSFNNEIGLPLTLLNLADIHDWAVVEMGMNHTGEIARLSQIASPDIAIIINTAGVHLETLGTVENVAKAKAEIFKGMAQNSTAIIPGNDKRCNILKTEAKKNKNIKKIICFGSDNKNSIYGTDIENKNSSTQFSVELNNIKQDFSINSPALFMVDNCIAAITAAMEVKITVQGMKRGIKAYNPVGGRMNIYKLNESVNLIDDTYNANPVSVTAALNILKTMGKDKKCIAILGDMLELGEESDKLHWQIGRKAASLGIDKLFIYGNQGPHTIKGAVENQFPLDNIFHGTKEKIAQKVLKGINCDTWLLVKGSRGMAMETIIQEFKQKLSGNS